jgi:hypothetical protein
MSIQLTAIFGLFTKEELQTEPTEVVLAERSRLKLYMGPQVPRMGLSADSDEERGKGRLEAA